MATRDDHTKISVCSSLPLVLEIRALDALQAHVDHATCSDVNASGNSNDIEVVLLAIGRLDTGLIDCDNKCQPIRAQLPTYESD